MLSFAKTIYSLMYMEQCMIVGNYSETFGTFGTFGILVPFSDGQRNSAIYAL